jgi:hypothetical protein
MQRSQTLDLLGRADVTTLEHIKSGAPSEFAPWLGDRRRPDGFHTASKLAATFPFATRMSRTGCGRSTAHDGLVYARHELSRRDRLTAASRLVR